MARYFLPKPGFPARTNTPNGGIEIWLARSRNCTFVLIWSIRISITRSCPQTTSLISAVAEEKSLSECRSSLGVSGLAPGGGGALGELAGACPAVSKEGSTGGCSFAILHTALMTDPIVWFCDRE